MRPQTTFFLLVLIFFNAYQTSAQLKVKTDGTVKIGSATAYPDGGDLQIVQINKTTEARVFAASANISRIWALNSIYCYAFGVDEGGVGQIWSNINTNTKIMSFNSNGCFSINHTPDNSYRLYVGGNILCSTLYQNSDLRLKRDVKPIDNSIDLLMKLEGRSFYYLNPDTLDKGILNRQHFGFIAQDVQKIIPDLVMKSSDSNGTLSVNYIGFIPILVEAIKTQQSTISRLENEISMMKRDLYLFNSDEKTSSMLYQNSPNPFTEKTVIKYFIDPKAIDAEINIYNLQGTQIVSFSLSDRGNSELFIEGSKLDPGMFLYSLIVDGKIIDTKQMVLTD